MIRGQASSAAEAPPLTACEGVDPVVASLEIPGLRDFNRRTTQRMKAGRKNLKKAAEEGGSGELSLEQGQSIMRVESLRGSNLIEVMDANGVTSLALFPAKFQKSFWIKRGSFVVVDESGREKALESGSKIACMVARVLFHEQVRTLAKSPEWPSIFRKKMADNSKDHQQPLAAEVDEGSDHIDDYDGLPPLEANSNRNRPVEFYSDSDSDPDTN